MDEGRTSTSWREDDKGNNDEQGHPSNEWQADYMYQEMKEKEDSPALKIASLNKHKFNMKRAKKN